MVNLVYSVKNNDWNDLMLRSQGEIYQTTHGLDEAFSGTVFRRLDLYPICSTTWQNDE